MRFVSTSLKTLAAALLVVSASSAFAATYKDMKGEAPCPPPKMLMGGFYLGAQAGYDSYEVQNNVNLTGVGGGTTNATLNATGWVGGLMLGYGQYFSDVYYLGGEIFGNYSNAEESHTAVDSTLATYNSKTTVNGSYGLGLLPGIKLNDATLAYIRLGYNWASIKTQESTSAPSSGSKTDTSGGFNYGVGMETLLYQNWSARAEYTHTNYGSYNTNMGTSVNPEDNQFMLGVLYHFA